MMSKIAGNFWLSPDGEVHYCISHNSMADDIVREHGWMNKLFEWFENDKIYAPDPEQFLEKQGWVKHCDQPWYHGWCIPPGTKLTQAQIDKIYELCGEVPEDSDLLGPYISLCTVIFLIFNIKRLERAEKFFICQIALKLKIKSNQYGFNRYN